MKFWSLDLIPVYNVMKLILWKETFVNSIYNIPLLCNISFLSSKKGRYFFRYFSIFGCCVCRGYPWSWELHVVGMPGIYGPPGSWILLQGIPIPRIYFLHVYRTLIFWRRNLSKICSVLRSTVGTSINACRYRLFESLSVIGCVVDPHVFQCGFGSRSLGQCGSGSSFGSGSIYRTW